MRQLQRFRLLDLIKKTYTKCCKRYYLSCPTIHFFGLKCQYNYFHYHYNRRYSKFPGSIISNQNRLFSYYSYCIPKPVHIKNKNYAKISPHFGYAGEDSFFTQILKNNDMNKTAHASPLLFIGVADGVGSWKPKKAKDAAKYSQELMLSGIKYLSSLSLNDICNDSDNNCYNVSISNKMAHFASTTVTDMQLQGASTLCLLTIQALSGGTASDTSTFKCELNAFNLGDSGFSVYRKSNDESYGIIYKSPAQEQGFGIPYQLGSHKTANAIEDGYCLENFKLKSRDIVIVGSDGLWDNLWDHQIAQIICQSMTRYHEDWESNNPQLSFNHYVHNQIANGDLSHKIMKQAYQNSIDKKISTPWSQAMTQAVEMVYDGGKPDDITCVVVFIH